MFGKKVARDLKTMSNAIPGRCTNIQAISEMSIPDKYHIRDIRYMARANRIYTMDDATMSSSFDKLHDSLRVISGDKIKISISEAIKLGDTLTFIEKNV